MCHGPRISLPGIAAAFSFRIPFLSYAPSSPSPAAAFGPAADSPHNLPADAVGPLTTFQCYPHRSCPSLVSRRPSPPQTRRPPGNKKAVSTCVETAVKSPCRPERARVAVMPAENREKPPVRGNPLKRSEPLRNRGKPVAGCAEPSTLRAPSGAGSRAHWPKPGRRLKNRPGGCAEP